MPVHLQGLIPPPINTALNDMEGRNNTTTIETVAVWVTNIDEVEVGEEMNLLLRDLNAAEREKALKFYFVEDQKRSLLSTLLQKAKIRDNFRINEGEYEIKRTPENKPYAASNRCRVHSWNYNVSHHGKYVCIASQDDCLVGVDIVDITTRTASIKTSFEYVKIFASQLTKNEIQNINSQSSEDERYTMFFIYWSLKESFIKAIGKGLGYDLQDIEFEVIFNTAKGISYEADSKSPSYFNAANCGPVIASSSYSSSLPTLSVKLEGIARATIKNEQRDDWSFRFSTIDEKHILSCALGPMCDAAQSYQSTAFADTGFVPTPSSSDVGTPLICSPISAVIGTPAAPPARAAATTDDSTSLIIEAKLRERLNIVEMPVASLLHSESPGRTYITAKMTRNRHDGTNDSKMLAPSKSTDARTQLNEEEADEAVIKEQSMSFYLTPTKVSASTAMYAAASTSAGANGLQQLAVPLKADDAASKNREINGRRRSRSSSSENASSPQNIRREWRAPRTPKTTRASVTTVLLVSSVVDPSGESSACGKDSSDTSSHPTFPCSSKLLLKSSSKSRVLANGSESLVFKLMIPPTFNRSASVDSAVNRDRKDFKFELMDNSNQGSLIDVSAVNHSTLPPAASAVVVAAGRAKTWWDTYDDDQSSSISSSISSSSSSSTSSSIGAKDETYPNTFISTLTSDTRSITARFAVETSPCIGGRTGEGEEVVCPMCPSGVCTFTSLCSSSIRRALLKTVYEESAQRRIESGGTVSVKYQYY